MNVRRSMAAAIALATVAYGASILAGKGLERMASAARIGVRPSVVSAIGTYTTLILASLALTACFGEDLRRDLGFRRPRASWLRYALLALIAGAATTLGIKLSPGAGMGAALKGLDVPVVLITVLYGSFAEELFTRGWFQWFLDPFRERRARIPGGTISVPVLASGILFGAMHLTLLGSGVDGWTIGFVLIFTTTVGLICAHARERTESLLPAYVVHLAGNAGGILGGILYVALYTATHGRVPEM